MRSLHDERGFSLVELMLVVLIIGILVAIAIPVFSTSRANAEERTCFSNQRIIESTAQAWSADHEQDLAPLVGVVTGGHPLISAYIFRAPPRCQSAPEPADLMAVTVAEGAYTLDDDGNVSGCTFGTPAHGKIRN